MNRDCSHACGGTCCRNFTVSAPPALIAELYADALAHIVANEAIPYHWDIVRIAEMLIPLELPDSPEPRYTCKHFDASAGRCVEYDQRPDMCRRFPYGHACEHCGYQNQLEPELVILHPNSKDDERAA